MSLDTYGSSLPIRNGENVGLDDHLSVNVNDISLGDQTNDVKVTMDGEAIAIYASGGGNLPVDIMAQTGGDVNVSLDGEKITIGDVNITAQSTPLETMIVDDAGAEKIGQDTMAESIPVVIASDQSTLNVNIVGEVPASPVHVPFVQADLAALDTKIFEYTATGIMHLEQAWASAAGQFRVEVKVGPDGSEVYQGMGFGTKSSPNVNMDFNAPIPVASGQNVQVIMKNMDKDSMYVYAFVNGYYQA